MKTKNIFFASLITAASIFSGCSTTADTMGSNVYNESQLNTKQSINAVNILQILPAKVAVDKENSQDFIRTMGGVLGIVAGSIIGYNISGHSSNLGAMAGGAAGGALGAMAGGSVGGSGKEIIEAVSLTYRDLNGHVYSSTQAGKACEFKPGLAYMITTKYNETRIQPNSVCVK